MNEWIRARAAQLVAEGVTQAEAEKQAREAYKALSPEVRARIEGAADDQEDAGESDERSGGLLGRLFSRRNLTIMASDADPIEGELVEVRSSVEEAEDEDDEDDASDLDERIDQRVQARLAELAGQPENPMAAIASGLRVRSQRLNGDQILSEVFNRTVVKQLRQQEVTAKDRQEVDNILAAHGIEARALTIEGNGTVIYEELAKLFVVKPSPNIVFRNHFRTLPMAGTKKVDFPRFDRTGLSFQWNRQNTPSTGSLTEITASDPTLDTFPIEVTELNGATVVADSFLHFNASGASFVSQYLLPEFRGAAQAAEDRAFWLGTKAGNDPSTFFGLRHQTGVTDANPAPTAGTAFSEGVLNSMLRAMPAAFRQDPSRLAYYLPLPLGDDFAELRAQRATGLGDRFTESETTVPGPTPIGRYRGINVYGIAQLPTNEKVGAGEDEVTDLGTAYLVHRDFLAIGDGLSMRIEPIRLPNFVTRIQLQEFVGLGYEWPTSVVRYSGIAEKE